MPILQGDYAQSSNCYSHGKLEFLRQCSLMLKPVNHFHNVYRGATHFLATVFSADCENWPLVLIVIVYHIIFTEMIWCTLSAYSLTRFVFANGFLDNIPLKWQSISPRRLKQSDFSVLLKAVFITCERKFSSRRTRLANLKYDYHFQTM